MYIQTIVGATGHTGEVQGEPGTSTSPHSLRGREGREPDVSLKSRGAPSTEILDFGRRKSGSGGVSRCSNTETVCQIKFRIETQAQ